MKRIIILLTVLCSVGYGNAQSLSEVKQSKRDIENWHKTQNKLYTKAAKSIQNLEPWMMVDDLWGVNDPQVTRKGDSLVLAVTAIRTDELPKWTGNVEKRSPVSNKGTEMLWVSLDPELGSLMKELEFLDSLSCSGTIKQLLGLPPRADYAFIVSFWISPKDLFRPTPNPDPTIHYSSISIPGFVDQHHREWLRDYEKEAYVDEPQRLWNKLGYSYDWGNPDHPFGVTEFVVKPDVPIRIESVASVWNWYTAQNDLYLHLQMVKEVMEEEEGGIKKEPVRELEKILTD